MSAVPHSSRSRRAPRALAPLASLLLVALVACGEYMMQPPPEADGTVLRSLRLNTSELLLEDGATAPVQVTLLDAAGRPLLAPPADLRMVWSSSADSIAEVDGFGVVTARRPGTAQVTVAANTDLGEIRAQARVVVAAVAAVAIIEDGDAQDGVVATALAEPLRVRVRDRHGLPVAGVTVTFTTPSGSFSPASATTDAEGVAAAQWTLGTVAGAQQAEVRVATLGPITFTATASPGPVARLLVLAGNDASGPVLQPLPAPLVAAAVDAHGNRVRGVTVQWSTATGHGSIAPAVGVTDTAGTMSATWTLGETVGTQAATAAAEGAEPALFTAQAQPATVSTVTIEPADTVLDAGDVATLRAHAADAAGNPITGRTVQWQSDAPLVATIDATGQLTALTAGTATIRATIDGVEGTAVVVVRPHTLILESGDAQTAVAGAQLPSPLVVRVLTASGRPVVGATVAWSVLTGSGTLVPASSTTDASGYARASWTLGSTLGEQRVEARAAAEGSPVTFTATATTGAVARVELEPSGVAFNSLGDTLRFTARAWDANGHPLTVAFTWRSTGSAATVADGLVTAAANGTAYVVAAAGAYADSALVEVEQSPASITVEPASASLSVGDSVQFTATVRDANGHTAANAVVSWSVAQPTLASITAAGRLHALAAGETEVRGSAGGVSALASVSISEPPPAGPGPVVRVVAAVDSARFTSLREIQVVSAQAYDADGTAVPDAVFAWRSSNDAVAAVAEGRITAQGNGSALVIVTSADAADTVHVAVAQVPVTLAMGEAPDTLLVGEGAALTATVHDANGWEVAAAAQTWTTSNADVVSVDVSGAVRALAPGTATIRVQVAELADSVSITVIPVPPGAPARVAAEPDSLQFAALQDTLLVIARVYDANDLELPEAALAWRSSNAAVATAADGRVVAQGNGSALVIVTSGDAADTVHVTVAQVPADLVITPDAATLQVGETVALGATVLDARGAVIGGAVVAWSSGDSTVAGVDSVGNVTGRAAGETRVHARSGEALDSILVTVTAPPPSGDVYEPNDDSSSAWDIMAPADASLDAADGAPGLPFRTIDDARGTALVSGSEDSDNFAFTLPVSGAVRLALSHRGGEGTLRVAVTQLGTNAQWGGGLAAGAGATVRRMLELTAGEYVVTVTRDAAPAGSADVPYVLELTATDAGEPDLLNGDSGLPLEPNDMASFPAVQLADALPYDVVGTLGATADDASVDLFALSATSGSTVELLLDSRDDAGRITLAVLEHAGGAGYRQVGGTLQVDGGASGALQVTLDGTGPYVVSLSGHGRYDLCVRDSGSCRTQGITVANAEQIGTTGATVDSLVVRAWGRVFFNVEWWDYADPQPNVLVKFAADAGTLSATEVMTNEEGYAVVYYTLPDVPGEYQVRAWVTGAPARDGWESQDTAVFSMLAVESIADRNFVRAVAGEEHSCALADGGQAYCWGVNAWGQLGVGMEREEVPVPVPVVGGHRFTSLAASTYLTTCGVTAEQAIYCWGYGGSGNLGDGQSSDSDVPVRVAGAQQWAEVAPGNWHTCALTTEGEAWCWGENAYGQLGTGTNEYSAEPVQVATDLRFQSISSGLYFTCAVALDGTVHCWGVGEDGRLGSAPQETCTLYWGSSPCNRTPQPIESEERFVTVSLSEMAPCATRASASTFCWGYNGFGQLGDGTYGSRTLAAPVLGGQVFTFTDGGRYLNCGVTDATGFCWGTNDYGQAGVSNDIHGYEVVQPTLVSGGLSWRAIDPGVDHTCGVTTTGAIYCWGENSGGKLGVRLEGGAWQTFEPQYVGGRK